MILDQWALPISFVIYTNKNEMYSYIDQNIISELLNVEPDSSFANSLKGKNLVISCTTISEVFQRTIKENILKELN